MQGVGGEEILHLVVLRHNIKEPPLGGLLIPLYYISMY